MTTLHWRDDETALLLMMGGKKGRQSALEGNGAFRIQWPHPDPYREDNAAGVILQPTDTGHIHLVVWTSIESIEETVREATFPRTLFTKALTVIPRLEAIVARQEQPDARL